MIQGQPAYELVLEKHFFFSIKDASGFTVLFTQEAGKVAEAAFSRLNGTFNLKAKPKKLEKSGI